MTESIKYLLSLIIFLAFLLVVFFVYLIIKGKKREAFLQHKERYIAETQDLWYSYLMGETETLKAMKSYKTYEIEAIEELFLSYLRNTTDQTIKIGIQKFARHYLKSIYREQLKSRKWSTRMNALYRIGDFRIAELFETCKKLLHKKISQEEYFEIVILSSYFDVPFFIQELMSAKVVFSEYEYKKLFFGMSESAERQLEEHFELLSERCQLAYIDTIGLKRQTRSLNFIESLVEHQQPEIRIRSLKAVYEIGVFKDVERLKPFISSSIWEERLMSARLLGRLPLEMAFPYLSVLIEDQNWWVRNQAAETIRQGKNGKEKLRQIAQSSKDIFAVDVAKEFLKEGGSL